MDLRAKEIFIFLLVSECVLYSMFLMVRNPVHLVYYEAINFNAGFSFVRFRSFDISSNCMPLNFCF